MADSRVYYIIYSDERYGLHRKLDRVTTPIPAGAEIFEYDQPEVPYVTDEVAHLMAEKYKAVMIDGVQWRVDKDGVTAYRLVPVIDELTQLDARSKLCCYDIPTGEWRRYVHQVTQYTEEEFKKMITQPDGTESYEYPPCWTPEEWNSLTEECRLILEMPVHDAIWTHVTDSRDPDDIGDNPVV